MAIGKKSVTLFKAISLALIVANLMTLFMHWLGASERGMSAGVGIFAASFDTGYTKSTSFWSVMLIINAILIILLSGLAIYGLLKDKNGLVLPLVIVSFVSFFLALFQKSFIGRSDLHVGVGAWLALVMATAIFSLLNSISEPFRLMIFITKYAPARILCLPNLVF